jgi:hypothetical protein
MKKQTAIEYLLKKLIRLGDNSKILFYQKEIEEAKEMEKQQIIYAHLNGQATFDKGKFREEVVKNAEQYYNETFEK